MTWLIPGWLKRAVAGVVAGAVLLWGAWMAGKREGGQRAETERHKTNAKAAKESKEIRHETETSDDTYLADVLSGRVRPKR